MHPSLSICENDTLPSVSCVYRTEDMALICKINAMSNNPACELNAPTTAELLLIADTLTLTFDGSSNLLMSFDAYTNKQRWKISLLNKLPTIEGKGLIFVKRNAFADDRYSLNVTPTYEVATNEQWLRVVFNEKASGSHYLAGDNLIVGISDGTLTDIFLLNIVFSV